MNPLQIHNIDMFRDGGTFSLKTNQGEFCVDQRIHTSTKGQVYSGRHPSDGGGLADSETVERIKSALKTQGVSNFPAYTHHILSVIK